MSQSRPTLSSPSRECPSLTACARSSVLPYVTPKWGHSDQPRAANPGKAHRRCLVLSRSRRADGIQRYLVRHGCGAASAHRSANVHLDDRRRSAAPRQPRQRAGDPSGPGQSDDRRARIAHTEQSVGEPRRLHAAQLWIALPAEHADMAPRFDHYPDLPQWQNSGVNHRLLVGEFGAYRSPVFTLSPLIAIDMEWQEAATVQLPLRDDYEIGFLPNGGIRT